MITKLKPCPFCGLQSHQDWGDTIYPSGIVWKDTENSFRHYLRKEQDRDWDGMCYKITCAETYGGCGASLVADSKKEVIDKWNRRMG